MTKSLFGLISIVLMLSACSGENGTVDGTMLSDVVNQDTAVDGSPKLSSSAEPKNILIFGGTSGVGLETVKLALSRGHKVTSVTRRPERMSVEHANLVNHKGDITKRDTFDAMLSNSDAVISAIGLSPTRNEVTVYSKGIENVLESMQQHGVKRVLTITGIGAGDSKGHGGFFYDNILNPLLLKTDYADKTRQEEILKKSEVAWSIIRPGFLTDDPARNSYTVVSNMRKVRVGDIARADVAHFLLASLEQGLYQKQTVLLSY